MMTDFLALNGWAVPILNGNAKRGAAEAVGMAMARSPAGKARRGERGWILPQDLRTSHLTPDHADALEGLLLGDFYHFPFDEGLYSEGAMLGPNFGYTAALKTSAPTPKFGTRYLHINSSGGSVYWTANRVTSWTLSWWHNHNNVTPSANGWTHYVVVYDATAATYTVYTDGAVTYGPSGTPPTTPGNYSASLSGTTLTFGLLGKQTTGVNTTTAHFDDLVMSRFAWPAELVAAIYNSGTGRAFSPEPFLDVSGDILNGRGPVEMCAALGDQEVVQGTGEDGWDYLRIVAFNLSPRERR